MMTFWPLAVAFLAGVSLCVGVLAILILMINNDPPGPRF